MPITIESTGPGLIELRGQGVQGIDWPAAGRGSVTVPLTIWRDTAGDLTLTLNGRAQTISIVPLSAGEAAPTALEEKPIDLAASALAVRLADDDSLAAWMPRRPEVQRRWLMLAAIAATLAVGAALPWGRKRGAIAAVAISVVACGIIAAFAPAPPARREQPAASGRRMIEIDYAATRAITVREPIEAGLWFAPRSPADIAAMRPVLECDAGGKPTAIRIDLTENARARFLRQSGTNAK